MAWAVCGDEITLRLETLDGAVSGIHWAGEGCAICMASASILSEMVVGLSRVQWEVVELMGSFREVMRLRGKLVAGEEIFGDAATPSGVSKYRARDKCAMLDWVAAEGALSQTT